MTYNDLLEDPFREEPLIDPDLEPTAHLCFLNMVALLAEEIIEIRNDPEAVEKRYAEIKEAFGPHMKYPVAWRVGRDSPPKCNWCGNEDDHSEKGGFVPYNYSYRAIPQTIWMHEACIEECHAADDAAGEAGQPV